MVMDEYVWVRRPGEQQKVLLETCPTWEHDPDQWTCSDEAEEESFLVVEGRAYVELRDGTRFRFSAGDPVTFPVHKAGDWTWVVEEKIKKHYIYNLDK